MKWKRPDWTRRQHDPGEEDERVFLKLDTFSIVRFPANAVPPQYENPRKKQPIPSTARKSVGVLNPLAGPRSMGSHDMRRRYTLEDACAAAKGETDKQKSSRGKRKYAKKAAKSIAKSPVRAAGWTLGNAVVSTLYTLNKADDAVMKAKDWKRKIKDRRDPASKSTPQKSVLAT